MSKFRLYSWVPEFQQLVARYPGPLFTQEPWLLVIHSGSTSDRVAEYLANPGDDRQVSAHVSYSRAYKDYVQQVPFNRVAWHAGGATLTVGGKKQGRLNFCSIGVERPGPPGQKTSAHEGLFMVAIETILRYNPALRMACRHSDIDSNKSDPGIDIGFLADYGLEVYRG